MPQFPEATVRLALRDLLLANLAPTGKVQRALIEYLFERSVAAGSEQPHISETHILMECKGGPSTESAARTAMSRLRANCEYFFAYHPAGRLQTYKVLFEDKEYLPQYDFNHPPSIPGDLIKEFWSPYYLSDRPIRIFYPELPHEAAGVSFTPTPIVQAATKIFEVLQKSPAAKFTTTALKATQPLPTEDEDIVLIGTAATTPQLVQLEASCPFRSGPENLINQQQPDNETSTQSALGEQLTRVLPNSAWALVSRTQHVWRGRSATSISANTFAAFPLIASFLTLQNDLKALADMLDDDVFPSKFQVLFHISLLHIGGHDVVHEIKPVRIFKIC